MAQSPIETAAGISRKWRFAAHTAWGYPFNYLRNVIEHTFAYTHFSKKVSAGTATAILGNTATVVAGTTITAGITNPDVPRLLNVTTGGTTADIAAGNVVITGTNVEGKVITDTLALSDNQAGATQGTKVFKTVTKIVFPVADGTTATISVGTQNKLGLVHRMKPSFTTVVVIQDGTVDDTTKPTVQAAPTSTNIDNQFVELNWVQPATTPDGTKFLYFFYWDHKVQVNPADDAPEFYSTTTSTSTSSTSTSTSTSSTSTSVSTSSTSVSSTSSSTSSTSTSTTTLPL